MSSVVVEALASGGSARVDAYSLRVVDDSSRELTAIRTADIASVAPSSNSLVVKASYGTEILLLFPNDDAVARFEDAVLAAMQVRTLISRTDGPEGFILLWDNGRITSRSVARFIVNGLLFWVAFFVVALVAELLRRSF